MNSKFLGSGAFALEITTTIDPNQNTSEYVKVSNLKRVFEEFQKESQVIEVNDGTEGTQVNQEQLVNTNTT